MFMSQRFRPWEHIRSPADFRRVFDRKRSVSDEHIILYACANNLPHSRLGLSVARKVGSAVRRNKLRRLYREAFRLTKSELPIGLDLVIIPLGEAIPTLDMLLQSFRTLVPKVSKRLAKEAKPS
jgi:ribonuclease P protein component